MSSQPIPLREVESYCNLMGIADINERENVLAAVVMLDNAWLTDQHERAEKSAAAKKRRGTAAKRMPTTPGRRRRRNG